MKQVLNRRNFLKFIGLGGTSLTIPTMLFAKNNNYRNYMAIRRPNILFIMADDHAANAIGIYGGRLSPILKTPNIDRIAEEGIRLDNVFCTNSICTPSRATILTGQYSHVNEVYTLGDDFDPKRENVAKLLQDVGYETAIVGKWHLHTEPAGFDYYNVLPNQGRYHDPLLKEKGRQWKYRNEGGEKYEGYVTDVIADVALKWLRNRNSNKPFFLMCHHKAPHGLWEYAERHKDLYEDEVIPEPPTLWEDKSHRSVGSREWGRDILSLAERMNEGIRGREWPTGKLNTVGMTDKQKIRAAYQKYMKDYLRCIIAIDENVGRLLDFLDESGLAENTVVIFTSDQGMFLGEHQYYDKRWMFKESLQMPFLVRFPAEIKPHSKSKDLIINVDFAPTFLDYAGVEIPDNMQGKSFRKILSGQTPANWRKGVYYRYWMHAEGSNVPAHYGIRTARYKLIFFYGLALGMNGAALDWKTEPGWELYDLARDPWEIDNVYGDSNYAVVVKKLKTQLLQLKKEYGDTDEKYPELMELVKKYWD